MAPLRRQKVAPCFNEVTPTPPPPPAPKLNLHVQRRQTRQLFYYKCFAQWTIHVVNVLKTAMANVQTKCMHIY